MNDHDTDPPGTPGDPFDLLGLEPGFRVDAIALRRAWLERSARLHPDRPGAPADAAARLAAVNRAMKDLSNPESRAAALMRRWGEPPTNTSKALPPGFLAEMLEVREALEEAQQSGDRALVEAFEATAAAKRREYIESFGALADRAAPAPSRDDLNAMRELLNAWRYIERMLEQIEPR